MKVGILTMTLTLACTLLVGGFQTNVGNKAYRRTKIGRRIVNGENTDPREFPFLVQFQLGRDALCGGSIIRDRFILTAAHCIYARACTDARIFPLSSRYTKDIRELHIDECIPYPGFTPGLFPHDIGLVRTVESLVIGQHLGMAVLPPPYASFPDDTRGVIVGWGRTEHKEFPGRMRVGNVAVKNLRMCNEDYRKANYCLGSGICPIMILPEWSICTVGTDSEPAGACDGDFGGPLIIDHTVVAVMSGAIMKNGGCLEGSPTLHILVTAYLEWMRYIVGYGEH